MDTSRKINKALDNRIQSKTPSPYHIGTMLSSTSVLISGMEITKESLLFAEHLTVNLATKVDGQVESGGAGDAAHTHPWNDKSTYITKLKAGDKVAIIRNGNGKFIILEKLVVV